MSYFGHNIKKIRTVKNLSQQAFADMFNLKRASVGAWEEGRAEPKLDTMAEIAEAFEISLDTLVRYDLKINELLKFEGVEQMPFGEQPLFGKPEN
ncbi:MAG TPA: transcriptional regulator, partial [Bacteroidales bacterium]|nr:transcriptional regulator [Bacteroidales bacterium]